VAQVVAEHPHDLATVRPRQVIAGDAADQVFGQPAWLQLLHPGAHLVMQAKAHEVGRQLAIEQPAFGFGVLQRLAEQVVHLQHLDAALAHLGDEVEMVTLGLADPQHVVEQQLVAVRWCETLMGKPG